MEHRTFERRAISVPLRLSVRDETVIITRSLEISPVGACIPDPGIGLKSNQVVTVNVYGALNNHFTRALVIHKSTGRIGLMFADILPLQRLMCPQNT